MYSLPTMFLFVILLYIPFVSMYPAVISWEHKITVDWENGTDNQSCLQGGVPCSSFNMALKGLTSNSTVIYISSGNYTLKSGSECDIIRKDHIAIIGSKDTVIRCNPLAGIGIFFSWNILIESVILKHCGRPSYEYQATLVVFEGLDIVMRNIVVQFSNSTGLIIDSSDNVTVDSCLIADGKAYSLRNVLLLYTMIGGGIWLIGVSGGSYVIINTAIVNNECISYVPIISDVTICPAVLGGGIIISYLIETSVLIDSCKVVNNSRGITIGFIWSSNISIMQSDISLNQNNSFVGLFGSYNSFISFIDTYMTDTLYVLGFYFSSTTINTFHGYIMQFDYLLFQLIFSYPYKESSIYSPVVFEEARCVLEQFSHRGTCSHNNDEDYTGHCPVAYSSCYGLYCFCDDNHRGRLCGQCREGYSVSVNSPYLSCVPCDAQQTVNKGWAALLGLEFIPLTFMVLIIIMLNVNLTQGSLNAYVFLCQILTISFPSVSYPSWIVTKLIYANRNIFLIPFSMWNLDWISLLPYHSFSPEKSYERESTGISICISSSTTPLGAISFWYVISVYPFLALLILYTIIILYNRGYKLLICWMRPFHCLLARFWRLFDIHPTLSHSVASVYTLCFTQLAATSLKLLHPTWYKDDSGNVVSVFFYDGSQRYFQGWHIPTVIAATLVLIGLIVITLYLSLYSFQWFQKCLNKLEFRKDFLISLSDVFMAPYKDGTDKTFDYRCFAGIRFSLLLIIMTFYYIPQNKQTLSFIPILELATCSVYICTIAIFRPYKRVIHTFTEAVVFAILGLFTSSHFFPDLRMKVDLNDQSYWYERLILPVLGMVLLLVVIPYYLVWLGRKCHRYWQISSKIDTEISMQDNNEQLADRLINPEEYKKLL